MIRNSDLGQFATHVLDFLKKKKINSLESLEKKVDREFDFEEGRIEIRQGENVEDEKVYILSYKIIAEGTPISLTVNTGSESFFIFVESADEIEGYFPLGVNNVGNVEYYKEIPASFANIRDELRALKG